MTMDGGNFETGTGRAYAAPSPVAPVGGQTWFTAAELAALKLPGLSSAKRKINELAQAERWALRTDRAGLPLARARRGRGGAATEYHLSVLPAQASNALVTRGRDQKAPPSRPDAASLGAAWPGVAANDGGEATAQGQLWNWFGLQSAAARAEASARLGVIDEIEALEGSGLTRSAAVAIVAGHHDASPSTVWGWMTLIAGADRADRLPLLAPQRKGGGKPAAVDAGAWTFLLSDYLRPERPTLASCYWRCLREYCIPRGLDLPHQKTLARKVEREVPAAVVTLKRHGADALRNSIPAQQRTVAGLHALEIVNIDGHLWDVFVRWPDGHVARPMMVAIQDVMSRKILSWRIDETESTVPTRLAFADLFKKYGVPKGCLMDNGRAFASKMMTGGAKTRFRFGIRDDDPTGLLPSLGIDVRFALPYRGQSKPIERAFRDLCDTVAKHPALAGAYTGNKPDAKPENYGERAIDLETFKRVVNDGIEAHNARPNRNTEMAAGRLSLDEVFNASYATAVIGKASEEQLRRALLASQVVSTDRKDGSVKAYGNVWWSEPMSALTGRKVILRYDPDDLAAPVHVYGLDGRFLATAKLQGRTAFQDTAAAHARGRQEANLKKTTKAQAAAYQLLTAAQLVAMMPEPTDEPEAGSVSGPSPSVIRPVRARGNAALKPVEDFDAPVAAPAQAANSITDMFAAAMVSPRPSAPALRLVE